MTLESTGRLNTFRWTMRAAAACAAALLFTAGCDSTKKEERKLDFKAALNSYYGGRPHCLWNHTVSFPAHADSSTDAEYNALVEAGLLSFNKKTKIYDLTAEGKAAWDADVINTGYGNFCYGHRKVVSIDSSKRVNATTMEVQFHHNLIDPAPWASNPAVEEVFPSVTPELAGPQVAEASVLDTESGWEVTKVQPVTAPPPRQRGKFLSRFRKKK